jgi:hypothetical protein
MFSEIHGAMQDPNNLKRILIHPKEDDMLPLCG